MSRPDIKRLKLREVRTGREWWSRHSGPTSLNMELTRQLSLLWVTPRTSGCKWWSCISFYEGGLKLFDPEQRQVQERGQSRLETGVGDGFGRTSWARGRSLTLVKGRTWARSRERMASVMAHTIFILEWSRSRLFMPPLFCLWTGKLGTGRAKCT